MLIDSVAFNLWSGLSLLLHKGIYPLNLSKERHCLLILIFTQF